MKCLYCPDFRTDGMALGHCSIDMIPGSINGLNEVKCPKHPSNRKLSDKVIKNNKLGEVRG